MYAAQSPEEGFNVANMLKRKYPGMGPCVNMKDAEVWSSSDVVHTKHSITACLHSAWLHQTEIYMGLTCNA